MKQLYNHDHKVEFDLKLKFDFFLLKHNRAWISASSGLMQLISNAGVTSECALSWEIGLNLWIEYQMRKKMEFLMGIGQNC